MDATKRIVILGKTGAGKSSLANTIFGEEVFTIDHTVNSQTRQCKAETRSINRRKITVIDTPGFFDTDRHNDMKREIVRCITECAPGPHAFLIVFKVEKFTLHEQDVVTKIREYFSEEVFKYATVVFTHGDQLLEGQTIKDFVSNNKNLSDLVKKCGGRCHVFDNKYWKYNPVDTYRSNQFQVKELLKTIDKTLLANKGGCYTNDMLQALEAEIQQEKENIRQSSGNMSEKEIIRWAKVNVHKKILIKVAGVTTGALLGAVFGIAAMVAAVYAILGSPETATLGHALQRTSVFGGIAGYNAAEGAKTPWEASRKAAAAVTSEAVLIYKKVENVCDRASKLLHKHCQ